jgi:hypothetical protein
LPRYFFNFENSDTSVADLVGRDLSDGTAARHEAQRLAAELATNAAVEGRLPAFEWVEVIDDCDRPIARLPVTDVVREPNRLR